MGMSPFEPAIRSTVQPWDLHEQAQAQRAMNALMWRPGIIDAEFSEVEPAPTFRVHPTGPKTDGG